MLLKQHSEQTVRQVRFGHHWLKALYQNTLTDCQQPWLILTFGGYIVAIKCRVCGKKDPEHIFHCEDHYKCEDCGTKDHLITGERLLCGTCLTERIVKDMNNFHGDTDYTDEITCPYCGHVQMDSWESTEREYDCAHCEKPYNVQIFSERKYTTTKVD